MTALALAPTQTEPSPSSSTEHFQPALFVVPALQEVPSRPAPAAQYRLTRRGRLVVFAATVVAFAAVFVGVGAQAVASFQNPTSIETTRVAVMPGMTLWEIAASANPGGDVRATIDDIVKLNALPVGQSLQIGAQLEVPVYR